MRVGIGCERSWLASRGRSITLGVLYQLNIDVYGKLTTTTTCHSGPRPGCRAPIAPGSTQPKSRDAHTSHDTSEECRVTSERRLMTVRARQTDRDRDRAERKKLRRRLPFQLVPGSEKNVVYVTVRRFPALPVAIRHPAQPRRCTWLTLSRVTHQRARQPHPVCCSSQSSGPDVNAVILAGAPQLCVQPPIPYDGNLGTPWHPWSAGFSIFTLVEYLWLTWSSRRP